MAITYDDLAAASPAPQVSAALFDPSLMVAAVAKTLTAHDGAHLTKFNQNAALLEALAEYGGGGRGVVWGLDGAIAGSPALTVTVTVGAGLIRGVVPMNNATFTLHLTDGTPMDNYLWLKQGGQVVAVAGSTAPPDATSIYLMRFRATSGVVTGPDYGGRVYKAPGGGWERRTGDPGIPGDTPPALWRGLTKTKSGLYLWDGAAYQMLVGGLIYNTQSGTSYATVAADKGKVIRTTNAAAVAVTVDTSLYAVGDVFNIRQVGAGKVTVSVAGGQTISSADGKVGTRVQGSEIACSIDAATVLHLGGDLG